MRAAFGRPTKGAGAFGTRPLCGHIFGIFLYFWYFFCIFGSGFVFFVYFRTRLPIFLLIFWGIASVSPCAARIRTCIFTPILRLPLPGTFSVLFALILLFLPFLGFWEVRRSLSICLVFVISRLLAGEGDVNFCIGFVFSWFHGFPGSRGSRIS